MPGCLITRRPARRGTIYVAVAGVTVLIATMAITASMVTRIELRTSVGHAQQAEARTLALSAVEFATNYLRAEPNWRNSIGNYAESAPITLGNGTFTWMLTDSDGDLRNDIRDNVKITGIGRVGTALAAESVMLYPNEFPLTCLEVALHVEKNLQVPSGSNWSWQNHLETDQTVSSNGNVSVGNSYASIKGNAWATGSISGNVTGSRTPGQVPDRDMPDNGVFDYYRINGAWINVNSLPLSSGKRTINRVLLSPNSNPFGGTNTEGIYVIDCKGQDVMIKDSRIVGTIVLLNNGNKSAVDGSIMWEPAVTNYPALLAEDDLLLSYEADWILSETVGGVNYNPPGTPFQGNEDTDKIDTYSTYFHGLIYVDGVLSTDDFSKSTVKGSVVCDDFSLSLTSRFEYSPVHFDNPPPGFGKGSRMKIIPGSWSRAAAP